MQQRSNAEYVIILYVNGNENTGGGSIYKRPPTCRYWTPGKWRERKGSSRATLSKSAPECPRMSLAAQRQLSPNVPSCSTAAFPECPQLLKPQLGDIAPWLGEDWGPCSTNTAVPTLQLPTLQLPTLSPRTSVPENAIYWAGGGPSKVELGFKQEWWY